MARSRSPAKYAAWAVCASSPARSSGDLGDLVPQLKGVFEVALRLGERKGLLGRCRCCDRRRQRLGELVAFVPVHRHLGGGLGGRAAGQLRVGGKSTGQGGVELTALAGQQVTQDDLLDQRVAKPVVVAIRVGDEQVVLRRFADSVEQRRLLERAGGGQQPVADPPARHRGHPQHLLRPVGQPVDAGGQQVVQRGRQPPLAATRPGREQLLGEERVAVGPDQDAGEQLRCGWTAEDASEHGTELFAVEPAQLEPLDGRVAVQLGQHRAERVAAVQFVAAVGGHQHDRGLGQVGHEEREQVHGRPVGPVQILDRQHQRPLGGQPLQQAQQPLEQLRAGQLTRDRRGGLCRAEVGDQPGQLRPPGPDHLLQGGRVEVADQLPQRLGDRRVGQGALTGVQATADEHPRAGRLGTGGELAQQAGLADPRFTAKQQHARRRASQRPVEPRELLGAADELRAGDAAHGRIIRLRPQRGNGPGGPGHQEPIQQKTGWAPDGMVR
jgi:hypothetical protein